MTDNSIRITLSGTAQRGAEYMYFRITSGGAVLVDGGDMIENSEAKAIVDAIAQVVYDKAIAEPFDAAEEAPAVHWSNPRGNHTSHAYIGNAPGGDRPWASACGMTTLSLRAVLVRNLPEDRERCAACAHRVADLTAQADAPEYVHEFKAQP